MLEEENRILKEQLVEALARLGHYVEAFRHLKHKKAHEIADWDYWSGLRDFDRYDMRKEARRILEDNHWSVPWLLSGGQE